LVPTRRSTVHALRVEGNCDERGGREYTLALGQKRAEVVRGCLVLRGASDSALEAVSDGNDKPADPGHNESAWAKNRHAEINYAAR
jgi:peptidoglycan-associated lipoprotein